MDNKFFKTTLAVVAAIAVAMFTGWIFVSPGLLHAEVAGEKKYGEAIEAVRLTAEMQRDMAEEMEKDPLLVEIAEECIEEAERSEGKLIHLEDQRTQYEREFFWTHSLDGLMFFTVFTAFSWFWIWEALQEELK